jgi:hypothetical protein
VALNLGEADAGALAALLRALGAPAARAELGVAGYGLTSSSLEEVASCPRAPAPPRPRAPAPPRALRVPRLGSRRGPPLGEDYEEGFLCARGL